LHRRAPPPWPKRTSRRSDANTTCILAEAVGAWRLCGGRGPLASTSAVCTYTLGSRTSLRAERGVHAVLPGFEPLRPQPPERRVRQPPGDGGLARRLGGCCEFAQGLDELGAGGVLVERLGGLGVDQPWTTGAPHATHAVRPVRKRVRQSKTRARYHGGVWRVFAEEFSGRVSTHQRRCKAATRLLRYVHFQHYKTL